MKTLAIDTSNFVMGLALVDDQQVVGEVITNIKKNHSVRVMPAIQALLKDCGWAPSDLERIVVAQGPGSYTGVRIGVTIAKTLAWTLQIPLVGVSSLEVLAANGRYFDGYIAPLFDARRGQIYTGLYQYNETIETVVEDQLVMNNDWAKHLRSLEKPVLFIGNDADLHREVLAAELGELAVFGSPTLLNPRPSELAFIGMTKLPVDLHTFVPNYIRMAEAEANWLASQRTKS
ncbi:tRNA (adenosine(37)-N6)-threonylcarbamoyltransferase complex dimerization subunit type 1 TsaB [Priestia koreensis]|uniref:tRNA (adenosine(37)-N6)-threonylcarbamoyltransferase complex dimerization subunit type 1 TsaB n=1 Tax=Priestia koreensis TaxID=284581 RepID=UPI00203F8F2C|nr:tRNA (adenosine(37)-N6)-threonylcarbamoyltransferase complex dimerization subunit type 1 TsaB [Priestia koreensis]MCM3007088.1 tRNA (adenosine(37)-N6)-threonylcarbamoyltransferase complex dimerization subunit type 1 TsaB [Priestia koreensis]